VSSAASSGVHALRCAGCAKARARRPAGAAEALHLRHGLRKALVLLRPWRCRVGRRQQAFGPGTVDEQALLRAVAQVAFVGHGAAQFVAHQAQFVQPLGHFVRFGRRQRQVVRAQRAGQTAQAVAAAVAAGAGLPVPAAARPARRHA
jgi:hypothetical protein